MKSPKAFSAIWASKLKTFYKAHDARLYSHLATACFFDQETLVRIAW